jgi:YD repeat-containing protein
MFQIGGSAVQFVAQQYDAELPGYDVCGPSGDVPWLTPGKTTMRLAPGASRTLTVRLSAETASGVDQPGSYTADLALRTDTPDGVLVLPVTMTVDAPADWARISGVVSGHSCDGPTVPLAGATVSFRNGSGTATGYTDADGRFARWVDAGSGRVQLVVAADHYTPAVVTVKPKAGAEIEKSVTLDPVAC